MVRGGKYGERGGQGSPWYRQTKLAAVEFSGDSRHADRAETLRRRLAAHERFMEAVTDAKASRATPLVLVLFFEILVSTRILG